MDLQANNATAKMNHAGLVLRLRALLWDYLLILLYIMLLVVLSLLLPALQIFFRQPVQSDVAAFVVLVLPVVLYFAIAESSQQGATWGKQKLGLRVIRVDGGRLEIWRSLLRSLIKFLPWQLAHTAIFHSSENGMLSQLVLWLLYLSAYGLVILYLLMVWQSATHRSLYDRVAGSIVVTG